MRATVLSSAVARRLPSGEKTNALIFPRQRRRAAGSDAGKAIFLFDGKGKLPKLDLPARGAWPKAAGEKTARSCLIVQAEMRPDGETFYGVIESHAIRMVPARELSEMTSLIKLQKVDP